MDLKISADIDDYLKTKREKFNGLLQNAISGTGRHYDAARYALASGGKRLRPILIYATAESFSTDEAECHHAALAIEMIHTYSLIHDDLPCMDDDDFRRGKPTVHKAYDEATAVLVGDMLLTFGFELIAQDQLLSDRQKVALVKILSERSGAQGMIAGQMMDLALQSTSVPLTQLDEIYRRKTADLIVASIVSGAIISEASQEDIATLTRFALSIGLAFQIIDDVIDVVNSEQKHGHATASDEANNKMSYVSLVGIDKAKQIASTHYEGAMQELQNLDCDTYLLQKLADKLVNRLA